MELIVCVYFNIGRTIVSFIVGTFWWHVYSGWKEFTQGILKVPFKYNTL